MMSADPAPYVLIVEDHPLVADSLKECCNSNFPNLNVLSVQSIQSAKTMIRKWSSPLIIITDLILEDSNGIESVRQLRLAAPNSKIIVCTALDHALLRTEAKKLGVFEYLIKSTSIQALNSTIVQAVGATTFFENSIDLDLDTDRKILTKKQESVLDEVSSGRTNKEIASRLDITPDTVATHMKAILKRLNAKNRTEAVMFYLDMKRRER